MRNSAYVCGCLVVGGADTIWVDEGFGSERADGKTVISCVGLIVVEAAVKRVVENVVCFAWMDVSMDSRDRFVWVIHLYNKNSIRM